MFCIKICGITTIDDAEMVAQSGADAVGLNFFPGSPRCIELEQARAIVEALSDRVVKVGLFVNAEAERVVSWFDSLGLDLIQLHGDEPPEFLAELGGRPIVRAFRLGSEGLAPISQYIERCGKLGCMPRMVLLDALVKGEYGGTGKIGDWGEAGQYGQIDDHPPLILAGGLEPKNVAAAIHAVRPHAVDTASGVESAPGKKDPAAVESFVRSARAAF